MQLFDLFNVLQVVFVLMSLAGFFLVLSKWPSDSNARIFLLLFFIADPMVTFWYWLVPKIDISSKINMVLYRVGDLVGIVGFVFLILAIAHTTSELNESQAD